tara:strand:+ start:628 stop:927 length:300 start_codon:yes stop_codon:yes gene_type:complete
MRYLMIITIGFLLLALTDLPIGYYTFLRIVVSACAVGIIITELKNGINIWVIIFGVIGIIFNPIIPIYLNNKDIWTPIDIVVAVLILVKVLTFDKKEEI